jgi:hypothetical protein
MMIELIIVRKQGAHGRDKLRPLMETHHRHVCMTLRAQRFNKCIGLLINLVMILFHDAVSTALRLSTKKAAP